MPTIFEPKDLAVTHQDGLSVTALANVSTSTYEALNVERFLYVVRGAGDAQVGGQVFPLETESILWIEAEDSYSLRSGADGLEVLLCHAPAGE